MKLLTFNNIPFLCPPFLCNVDFVLDCFLLSLFRSSEAVVLEHSTDSFRDLWGSGFQSSCLNKIQIGRMRSVQSLLPYVFVALLDSFNKNNWFNPRPEGVNSLLPLCEGQIWWPVPLTTETSLWFFSSSIHIASMSTNHQACDYKTP